MALLLIAPGNSPQYRLKPNPAGIPTSIDLIGWAVECSDGSDVEMTSNQNDKTGMTATLDIPLGTTVGAQITFWGVYRNLSGNEVTIGPMTVIVVKDS